MKEAILKMSGITKVFSTEEMETHALRGIDLEIYKGDFVSICGPSGCGKSTLLSILGLLDTPTDGSYQVEGIEVSKLSLSEAAHIRNQKVGFIFQSFNLIDELTVFENIALPLRYRKEPMTEVEITQAVTSCLTKVDMGHRASHRPNQLSGGQQQRIAIARALVGNPALLLVDEPTGNLDSKNGDAVMDMLKALNLEGTTLCMVTHDPRYADMATRKLHLLDGKILTPQEQSTEKHSEPLAS
ncbi:MULTISPECIES: ABC transporter ATP-binding protein [Pseudoalteromonas]|uniref:ABC transporter ATP-binding protein n=1 Tax=Pseudoalteromonas TaxID=53246 RepID=UPI00029B474C|nr:MULTISPECIES: ABC transporter ATP-binding protein [Pseudoalteromonas]AUJ68502.1 Lipoprotein-releasing system ATP-binding protein LolD [Pseudoalteromonas sp. NC201]MBR8844411.1 ABC transporter ATP-binding protein [Pseudoalteromonas sp. JC3]MCF2829493.1 ABC transporter ATP-binding protein [Pseudoalteromonas sp. OF5H-5]MCF2831599.1 ABC transporter ATP-binding protein [Pseudoalteromonas sp. DL2-H6]MCF2927699.1 ABC transporter ATP-binding protein [Pseudoalteromonas sp. DL2-H1]